MFYSISTIYISVICILTICLIGAIIGILFLIYKQKRTKKISEQIDYFLRVTHDLKTPLSAIEGYTVLTKLNLDDPVKASQFLGKISNMSKQMNTLVNDILDMSQIQHRKIKIQNEIKNLQNILMQCLETIEIQSKEKNLNLKTNIQIIHPIVLVDELRLKQILVNFLSNSIKYTESYGSIQFNVKEIIETIDQSKYEFQIQDTGCGMSEDFIKHIFEPFSQERAAIHTDVNSSGLGMSIAKQLIDLMEGTVCVQSKLGVGSCFTITIPLKIFKED